MAGGSRLHAAVGDTNCRRTSPSAQGPQFRRAQGFKGSGAQGRKGSTGFRGSRVQRRTAQRINGSAVQGRRAQKASTVCTMGIQPSIPAVYGVKAPLYG